MKTFLETLQERVLIFDGAMGTSVHKYNLSADDYHGCENCMEILVESRPDVIREIHASFFAAGCDVVETCTFGGSPVVLAEFGLARRALELNRKAARLACAVAQDFSGRGQRRFVSGSIGPTTKLPSLGHISFRDMKDAYYQQVSGLIAGGVDLLQFETGQDLLQAKACLLAIDECFRACSKKLPVIAQITIEAPPMGTMLTGSDISAALATLQPFEIIDVIGMNCATGPDEMMDPVHFLCENSSKFVSVLPNAGLPENIKGKTVYKLTPERLAESLKYFACQLGVNIVGGCCGTTPQHMKRVVEVIGQVEPKTRDRSSASCVSSLYTATPLAIEAPPLFVGERTNTNGSKKFKELLEKEDWDGMVAMAREQERQGAHMLDVSTAYVGRNEVADMSTFLKRLNTEAQSPIVIDTTEFPVLEASLQLIAGRPIVNSINLEDGEEKMLAKVALITRYGAAAVALTIDEKGMARTAAHKLAIARRIYDLAVGAGLSPQDLIFDALTFTLSTGNQEDRKLGIETLEGIRLIKENLPGVKTILGASNISFGFAAPVRRILNSVFLHYAVEAGLDLAIVHASKILPLYKINETERTLHENLLFDRRTDDCDPLFALLDYYKDRKTSEKSAAERDSVPVEERLKQRIIEGDRVGLEKDLSAALKVHEPIDIINNILLDGMKEVGDLFGAGKMQLPFVLQAAETMKAAVSFLQPFMQKKVEAKYRGSCVLATVKGDVHDIGKNLVDIILSNNGYKIYNLGIKQPIENIINAALEHKVDFIGMSGLLVKSTVIMKENLEILNQRQIDIPVILGGAALTKRYVEEDCRSVYKGPVLYGQDAFDNLRYMEAFFKGGREALQQFLKTPPQSVPPLSQNPPAVAAAGSGGRRSQVARGIAAPAAPFIGSKVLDDVPLTEVFPYLNENVLIRGQWRVRQQEMPDHEYQLLLAEKIIPCLRRLQVECVEKSLLVPKAVYGYFPCQSSGNELIIYRQDMKTEWLRFNFPRQDHGSRLCISDYFASLEEGRMDIIGCQVVTMGKQASAHSQKLFESDKYTDYLYFHGLSVECAEAMAEYVHKKMRAELGFANEDASEIKKMINQGYRGSRYSFGYPACPDIEDQSLLFELLQPERIDVSLTEEYHLVPEQSTTAIVVCHPEAKYFNIKATGVAAAAEP
jgi:5-methyltetrahydrofolate--homocysteine methyltransferase